MKISVALPAFKSKEIAWLALTGLQRQQFNGEFELIVCEEKDKAITESEIEKYGFNLKYISLDKWIPLPQKWRMMAQQATGDIFLLQAADCYPHPLRLKRTLQAFKSRCDWYHERSGIFYDINHKLARIYAAPGRAKTALNMAMKMEYAKALPLSDQRSSIDFWLLTQSQKMKGKPRIKTYMDSGSLAGFDTNGYNHISKHRIDMMLKCYNGYSNITDWAAKIPKDVFERVKAMR